MTTQLERWPQTTGDLYFGVDKIGAEDSNYTIDPQYLSRQERQLRYWTHYINNQTRRLIRKQTSGVDAFTEVIRMQSRSEVRDGTVYVAYLLDKELTVSTCSQVSPELSTFLSLGGEEPTAEQREVYDPSLAMRSFQAGQYPLDHLQAHRSGSAASV